MSIDLILASSFGVVFITAMLALAIKFPNPTPFQALVFRSVLALSAGGVAAFIPGFLQIQVGLAVRAGGALAVFVLVYKFNPARLVPHERAASEFSLHISIRETDRPPAIMDVTNIGKATAVVSSLSVRQFSDGASVMTIPFSPSIRIPHDGSVAVNIQGQLNKFVWEAITRA